MEQRKAVLLETKLVETTATMKVMMSVVQWVEMLAGRKESLLVVMREETLVEKRVKQKVD